MQKEQIAQSFKHLQHEIIHALETIDGKQKFISDVWERPGGGGGDTRVISNGAVFEKGGVNFSEVHGDLTDAVKTLLKSEAKTFYATGVSIVIHPQNPWIPIIHMNVRYFELPEENKWWFGGGIDLTPHYVDIAEADFFHHKLKETCDKHNLNYYARFKKWADEYFYIKHRKETRGIGGVFFDHLNTENESFTKSQLFDFVYDVGKTFIPAYKPLVEKNKDKSYTEKEIHWQRVRRGRYVEFNLVYDRGTTFGLKTDGRVESILMSLPATASWEYNYDPEVNTLEKNTLQYLKKEI